MAEEEKDDKEFDPTQQKLDQARKKGDVPKSTDLIAVASMTGFLSAYLAFGGQSADRLGVAMARLIDLAALPVGRVGGAGNGELAGTLIVTVGIAVAPFFGLPAIAAILAIAAQRGFAPSGEKLIPKLSRIDPISNAKNKFGSNGLFEFAKSLTKLTVITVILGLFLVANLDELILTMALPDRTGIQVMLRMLFNFLVLVAAITVAIGAVDFMWQHHSHKQKLRMSRKEMKDEHKQNEGDPHIKQQRRRRAQEIAMNQMLADVPDADVVIVNPEHYAVALKWDRLSGGAPVCVAKGVDEIAARIREAANEAGVPIHRDAPTARALYATVEIGHEIHPDHYRTVAAAIRFSEQMRALARQKMGRDA